MATSYTSLLGFALPVTGELDGTWGDVVNNSITQLVEDSVAGVATASVAGGDWTLTTTGSGAANQARCAILIPTGTPGVSRNIIAPSKSKAYVVINQSDAAVVLKGAATTGVTIATGTKALCAWNGSDFVTVGTAPGGSTTQVQYNNAGVFAGSANLTFDGTTLTGAGFSGPINGTIGATTPSTGVFTQVDITAQGDLRLQDSAGGQYAAIQAPATIASSYTLTLPTTDGNANEFLQTDGSGVLTWAAGATGDVTAAGNNAFTGANTFYNNTGQTIGTGTSTQDGIILAGRAGGTNTYRVTFTPATLTGNTTLTFPGVTDTVAVIGTAQTFTAAQTFRAASAIRSEAASTQDAVVIAGRAGGTNSYAVTVTPATLSASRTATLPDGGGNYTLGYLNIPAIADKTGAYTLAVADVGKVVGVGTGGSIEIPNSTFAAGDAVLIFNNTSAGITITCTITTAYIAGTDADKATVTLATRGVANILFISATACVITGNVS